MKYTCTAPDAALSDYIRFYWSLESDQPYIHRAMADSCAEMVFHFKGRFMDLDRDIPGGNSVLSAIRGTSASYSRFSCNEPFGIFGVYLYPGALPRLLNIPGIAVSNNEYSIRDVLPIAAAEMEERIQSATGHDARCSIMNNLLSAFLPKIKTQSPDPIDWVLKQYIHHPQQRSIEHLAGQCFLSRRQFERKFREASGLNPGLYANIVRFQHAASFYGSDISLTQIAYECGYYDQSHFIRDFRRFAGFTPSQFFKGHAEGTAWRDA